MKITISIFLGILLIVFPSGKVAAAVAYSNLGPGDSFVTDSGLAVNGSGSHNGANQVANGFTSLVTGTINSVEVGLFGIGSINVGLQLNDPITNLPLTSSNIFLGTILISSPPLPGRLVNLIPGTPVSLVAGGQYWLVLSPTASDTDAAWGFSVFPNANPAAISSDGGQTFALLLNVASAFRINAAPVPEPSILALLGAGVIAIGVRNFRRRSLPDGDP